ncbi:MAG: S-adenosylmethionine:tRNA ribosyltransferase-isomerase [Sandaracinaceae bacterium]
MRPLEPARGPRPARSQRLLHVDRTDGALRDLPFEALTSLARPGDVWVLNDAATLPAALQGTFDGEPIEIRLAGYRPGTPPTGDGGRGTFRAVLFGAGSWRDDTDRRPAPPRLGPGDTIQIGPFDAGAGGLGPSALRAPWSEGRVGSPSVTRAERGRRQSARLRADVVAVDERAPRLVELRFREVGAALWAALYALGRPIQYRYQSRELGLGEVQTAFAGPPLAAELPSAGRPLSLRHLSSLRRAGAEVVSLTHAAGISATGDPDLDRRLPLPERYAIPDGTAAAVSRAWVAGRRIVAVGTSVTRALEGAFDQRGLAMEGEAETDLRLGPDTPLRVVGALLTGAHDPGSSHYDLLAAFLPRPLLERAGEVSARLGYVGHEFGDSWFIGGGSSARATHGAQGSRPRRAPRPAGDAERSQG